MWLARRMGTPVGRGGRVVVGLALIGAGAALHDLPGLILAIVGLVPLVAGLGNVCLAAPLLGAPLRGGVARGA